MEMKWVKFKIETNLIFPHFLTVIKETGLYTDYQK